MGFIRGAIIESLLAALGGAGILVGFILIVIARRGRRVDDHPLCRKCGYDLTGRPDGSDRCAECGADLSRRRAVRVGNRVPHRPLFWAGLSVTAIFLVLTSAFVWVQFSRVDLMRHKPVWLLRSDASSLLANKRVPAVTELTRRFTAGELTDAQIQALISDALVFQANPSFPWKEWGILMNKTLMAGQIGDADWTTFVRQAVNLKFITRTKVRAGDPMPVTLTLDTARLPWRQLPTPAAGLMISLPPPPPPFIELEWLDAEIAGVQVINVSHRKGRYPGMARPTYIQGAILYGPQTAGLANGVHRLSGHVVVSVLNEKSQKWIANFTLGVNTDVTILPAATNPKQLFVSDPALSDQMQKSISKVRVTAGTRGSMTDVCTLDIGVSNLPAGLAHQAFLRTADGKEVTLGSITLDTGFSGSSNRWTSAEIGRPDNVDVILRPDFDLVTQTTRSDPVWGEEIVFHDVKVMPRGTPIISGGPRPTTTSRPGG